MYSQINLLPRAHAQGGKVISLVVVVITVITEIVRSRVLAISASANCCSNIENSEKTRPGTARHVQAMRKAQKTVLFVGHAY